MTEQDHLVDVKGRMPARDFDDAINLTNEIGNVFFGGRPFTATITNVEPVIVKSVASRLIKATFNVDYTITGNVEPDG